MAALVALIASRGGPAAAYASTLLAAFTASQADVPKAGHDRTDHARPGSLVEPLTERELEVLQLVAAGLSNHAIAQRLVVAVSTVKKHLNNLYAKLGVQSRTQAIVRARELHLHGSATDRS